MLTSYSLLGLDVQAGTLCIGLNLGLSLEAEVFWPSVGVLASAAALGNRTQK